MRLSKSTLRAFSMVEVVVAAGIVAVIVTGIASAWQFYLKVSGESARLAQATLLAEEGAEAMQYIRDLGWTANIAALTPGQRYYLVRDATDYELTTTPTLIDNIYYRAVDFKAVNRDTSANISETGTEDQNSRIAYIEIYPATTTVPAIFTLKTYIFKEYNN